MSDDSTFFLKVPYNLLRSNLLDPFEKAILFYLATFNPCFPGQERIAKDLGISLRHVKRMIKSLKDKGYLTIESGKGGNGYEKKSNRYDVNLKKNECPTGPSSAKKTEMTRNEGHTGTRTRAPQAPEPGPHRPPKYYQYKNINLKGEKDESAPPFDEGGLQGELPLKTLIHGEKKSSSVGNSPKEAEEIRAELFKWATK